MSDPWSWFRKKPEKKELKQKEGIDYYALAEDADAALKAIKNNPDILFHVVAPDDHCDLDEYVMFIHLLIEYKNITEPDIVDIENLDWFRISEVLPMSLSMTTLERYKYKVNWKAISSSVFYTKDKEFIRQFSQFIDWEKCRTTLTIEVAMQLFFFEDILPFQKCVLYLNKKYLQDHAHEYPIMKIGSSLVNMILFIKQLGAKETETIFEKQNHDDLKIDSMIFALACCDDGYVPQTPYFINLLKKAYAGGDWFNFITSCRPAEDFINEHILSNADKDTFLAISNLELSSEFIKKHKSKLNMKIVIRNNLLETADLKAVLKRNQFTKTQAEEVSRSVKLPPEYIDEFATQLDWYFLCEFQDLPEWLMEKHADKLNWGQVSMYQMMSAAFIAKHQDTLNPVKLQINKKIRK